MALPALLMAQSVADLTQIDKDTLVVCFHTVGQKRVMADRLCLFLTDKLCNNINKPVGLPLFNELRRIYTLGQKPDVCQVKMPLPHIKALFAPVIDNGFLTLILVQPRFCLMHVNSVFDDKHGLVNLVDIPVDAAPLCVNPADFLQIADNVCG